MEYKRIFSIPILSVFLLLGFVYYVTVFIFIEDCLRLSSSAGSRTALIFTSLAFLCIFSFLVCILTDPGSVPSGFVPDVEGSLISDQENKNTIIMVNCVRHKDWDFKGVLPLKLFYVASGTMIFGLTLTLGTLLSWHIYLTVHNMTTIEYYEGKRAAWLARKSGLKYHHPFDVGPYRNISLILGPNMLKWLCPTAISHIKDGLNFPATRDSS